MTVSSSTSRVSYTGNGSTTGFAIPFAFPDDADIAVYVADVLKIITVDYTISSSTVNFLTAPVLNAVVVIFRDPELTQETDYSDNDAFPASATEDALDKAIMIDQRTREMLDRSVRLSDGDAEADMTLPLLADRSNLVFTFDENGLPTAESVPALGLTFGRRWSVTAVSTTNITLSAPGATIDGRTMVSGDVWLAKGQTVTTANGIYVWNGAATPATRHTLADTMAEIVGTVVTVLGGTNAGTAWWNANNTTDTLGTTAIVFDPITVTATANLAAALSFVGMFNGKIVESHTGNAVTFTVQTRAGNVPSATDPVYFVFHDGTGGLVTRTQTATLAITISSGSTLGATTGFRFWIGALDNSGAELFVVNCLDTSANVLCLRSNLSYTTVAEGGAGAADSSKTLYSTTARTTKMICLIGYADYDSGLTAGTYNASPTRIIMFGPGMAKPGESIGNYSRTNTTGAVQVTTAMPNDDSIPQITEGGELMTHSHTPSAIQNVLRIRANAAWLHQDDSSADVQSALFQSNPSVASALAATQQDHATANRQGHVISHVMKAGSTSALTFSMRAGTHVSDQVVLNGLTGPIRIFGGVANSYIEVDEIMT